MSTLKSQLIAVLCASVFLFSFRTSAQCELGVITNPTTQFNFGKSVSLNENFVYVGAPYNEKQGGGVFVFRRLPRQWLPQEMTNPSGQTGYLFGSTVAASGLTLVVGNNVNNVHIYDTTNGTPQLKQFISHENEQFGWSIDIADDLLAIGAPDMDSLACEDAGAVYLYRQVNDLWTLEAELFGGYCETFAGFGRAVAITDGLMMTGDFEHDGPATNTGAAFVFRESKPGEWLFEAELKPSDYVPGPDGSGAHWFGYSVALDSAGDTAIIGARNNRIDGLQSAGSAYVFEYDGENWIESAKLTANPPNAFGEFGKVVDISDDGNTIIVGETFFGPFGVAHIFRRINDSNEWEEVLTVEGNGWAIDIDGDLALLSGAGQVRVFAGINDIDCNKNGEPDGCDIANGISADINDNGVPDECEVLPDFDGDGFVDADDLLFLLSQWGTDAADIDGDGSTNVNDLLAVLAAWGEVNPPATCPDNAIDDCCSTHESPGCDDPECCQSICEIDPFCCNTTWDAICVNHAQDLCGCPGPQGCGEPDSGSCCIPGGGGNGSPGCDDPECCEIVCDYVDPFCCEVEWDATCGEWAFQLCASCPPVVCSPDAGQCCAENGSPGCEESKCCEMVCLQDPFCCEIAWDGVCADTAGNLCAVCQE